MPQIRSGGHIREEFRLGEAWLHLLGEIVHGLLEAGEERHGDVRGGQKRKEAQQLLTLGRRNAAAYLPIRLCGHTDICKKRAAEAFSVLQVGYTPISDMELFRGFPYSTDRRPFMCFNERRKSANVCTLPHSSEPMYSRLMGSSPTRWATSAIFPVCSDAQAVSINMPNSHVSTSRRWRYDHADTRLLAQRRKGAYLLLGLGGRQLGARREEVNCTLRAAFS
jgi:hypothetical protein